MSTETPLQRAETLLAPWAQSTQTPEPNRLDVSIGQTDLVPAVGALRQAQWGYLSAITGLDHGPETGEMEALYHFCVGPMVVTLRISLPRDNASVPSICELIPSAGVYERELMEMLGVTIEGLPYPARLFLPDEWPTGVHPLRKDFELVDRALEREAVAPVEKDKRTATFTIPIGPQHPALKEPEHFEFAVDGEFVTRATVRLGYAHRGIEKAAEGRTWVQNLYLMERICGICSHIHATAYCLCVEKLAGVNAPPRAQAIRELVAGLERIHSHLLWFGVAAHEAGFDTLFMYSWRDRETVMDILEEISGNRVNYSANVLGGVKIDITPAQMDTIRRGIDFLEERTRHYLDVVTQDAAFLQRTRGIGVMTKAQALEMGVVGPTARASGVARDIRVEAPYSAYTDFPIRMVLESAGDLEARFVVRLKELLECYATIRDLLDRLPEGDLTARMPRRIKAGETIGRVEAPRGELFYFVKSNGTDKPERIKVRTPTLCNMASVAVLVVGSHLADVPMILVGVDPCFSCNDRSAVIKQGSSSEIWSWEKVRQYGIEYYR
jgi:ech hydrogenase subunit E